MAGHMAGHLADLAGRMTGHVAGHVAGPVAVHVAVDAVALGFTRFNSRQNNGLIRRSWSGIAVRLGR